MLQADGKYGIKRRYVSDVERGLKSPSLATIAALAEALGFERIHRLTILQGSPGHGNEREAVPPSQLRFSGVSAEVHLQQGDVRCVIDEVDVWPLAARRPPG